MSQFYAQAFRVSKEGREWPRIYAIGFMGGRKIHLHKEDQRWLQMSITPALEPEPDQYPDWQVLEEDEFNRMVFEAMEQVMPGWVRPFQLTIVNEQTTPPALKVTPATVSKACARCGSAFEAKTLHAEFCSTRCRVAAHRAKGKTPTAQKGNAPVTTTPPKPAPDLWKSIEDFGFKAEWAQVHGNENEVFFYGMGGVIGGSSRFTDGHFNIELYQIDPKSKTGVFARGKAQTFANALFDAATTASLQWREEYRTVAANVMLLIGNKQVEAKEQSCCIGGLRFYQDSSVAHYRWDGQDLSGGYWSYTANIHKVLLNCRMVAWKKGRLWYEVRFAQGPLGKWGYGYKIQKTHAGSDGPCTMEGCTHESALDAFTDFWVKHDCGRLPQKEREQFKATVLKTIGKEGAF